MKAHLALLAASVLGIAASPLPRQDTKPAYFFTFGNSYTQTDFSPNGTAPSISNPMGNPALGSGTTAGGPNWLGYLTTAQNASHILSYNLAVGGATIDTSIVTSNAEGHNDLVAQMDLFQSRYSSKTKAAPWTGENAVFGFWFGINDIGNAYSSTNAKKFTPRLIARYRELVERIYRDDGRKFLFINVPPTSRTPTFLQQGQKVMKEHAKYLSVFNNNFESMVKSFAADHKDATVVLYDSYSFMTRVLGSPQEYGFPNATCVNDDGSSCVWWNSYHPTSKYHRFQAEDMKKHLEPLGAW